MTTRARPASLLPALLLITLSLPAPPAAAQYDKKPNQQQKKVQPELPKAVVVRFQSAQRQRVMGQDLMVVAGIDALTGRPWQFAVENEQPQDRSKVAKYDPRPAVADAVKAARPGDYLRVEPRVWKDAKIPWADRAVAYAPADHEEEPNVYVFDGAYKETVGGTDGFKVELTKFARPIDAYVQMVPGDGKTTVPDPAIVRAAEAAKRKDPVEATLVQKGGVLVVTSLDPYQPPRQAKFTKVAEADVGGQKGQAVELDEGGKALTLPLPGKVVNKKWVTDPAALADARKLKAGAAVVFRTRDVDGTAFVRQIAAAPKEPAKEKEAAAKPARGGRTRDEGKAMEKEGAKGKEK